MSMKIILGFLMLAPALAKMSAVKRCSLSLISKATKADPDEGPASGCEGFGSDLKKSVVEETIPLIKEGVVDDQKLISVEEEKVKNCNKHLSDGSNSVAQKKNDVDAARSQHIKCRKSEAPLFVTAEAKSQSLTSFLGSPSDPCGGIYPSEWEPLASCFKTQVDYHKQMNMTLYEKVEAYTKAHGVWKAKKDECNKIQAQFEVKYCGWRELAETTIKSYDQCWLTATQSYETTKATVTESFDNNVKEYVAAKRLLCIADATLFAADKTKVQAQLDHCHNMDIDTSDLTLNIPADFPPEKNIVDFGDQSVYPGHADWVGQEYASLDADKSPHAEVTPCADVTLAEVGGGGGGPGLFFPGAGAPGA